ncbi:hypothetical protein [Kibdelosporangium philippinense]
MPAEICWSEGAGAEVQPAYAPRGLAPRLLPASTGMPWAARVRSA